MTRTVLNRDRSAAQGIALPKNIGSASHHGVPPSLVEQEPARKQFFGACKCVRCHQPDFFLLDLRPDIDLVGDEDWPPAGQCLGDCYTKVFLMRRKNEGVAAAQRSTWGRRSSGRASEPGRLSPGFAPGAAIWLAIQSDPDPRSQGPHRDGPSDPSEGFDEQIASLFLMDARQEEYVAMAAESRQFAIQSLRWPGVAAGGSPVPCGTTRLFQRLGQKLCGARSRSSVLVNMTVSAWRSIQYWTGQ